MIKQQNALKCVFHDYVAIVVTKQICFGRNNIFCFRKYLLTAIHHLKSLGTHILKMFFGINKKKMLSILLRFIFRFSIDIYLNIII